MNWIMETTTTGGENSIQWIFWIQLNFADHMTLMLFKDGSPETTSVVGVFMT